MPDSRHTIRQELHGILAFVGVMWAVFFATALIPSLNLKGYGVVPRTLDGLIGIAAMPFLHANLNHLMANTVPLLVLLVLLAGSRARSWEIVLAIVVCGGLLLWLVGRPANHIGASGLIFGLIAFLIVSGFLEKRPLPLLISLLVGFFYGGTLLSGVLPQFDSPVSWEGHLCGAVAGGGVAYALTHGSGSGSRFLNSGVRSLPPSNSEP